MTAHSSLASQRLLRSGLRVSGRGMMASWRQKTLNFCQGTSGTVAVIFGVAAFALFIVIGAAVDYGRWHNAKSRTLAALDAAALAAGRALQTNGGDQGIAKTVGEQYFAQATADLLKVAEKRILIQFTDNGTAVVATSPATITTPFLALTGIRNLPLFVQGQVGESDVTKSGAEYAKATLSVGANSKTSLEISLMLDTTGSMCDDNNGPCASGSKMDAMKSAASDLVNIVVWDNQGAVNSRVAVVPFARRVRVAPDGSDGLMRKLTNLDDKWTGWYNDCTSSTGGGGSETGGNWACQVHEVKHHDNWKIMPCVTDRTGPAEFTDAAPGPNQWLNAHGGDRMAVAWDSADTPASTRTGKTKSDPADHWNFNDDGSCADNNQANTILPLTSEKPAILNTIAGLQAYGGTGGQLGTAFAWYTLSPQWNNIWPSQSRPGSYGDLAQLSPDGTPKLKKIAVLMTDGSYNTYRGWSDQNQATVSNGAKTLCGNMKAQGIEIYAVGFDLDALPAGEKTGAIATLQACSSNPQSFYNATDAEQLKQAFRDIALKISTLHITN